MHASDKATRPGLYALAFAISAAFATPALAQHAQRNSIDAERRTEALTNELVRSLGELERASPARRAAHEARVQRIVSQRAEALSELAEKNPQAARLKSLPERLRSRVPSSAIGQVEQEVDATGVMVGIIKEDFENHRAEHEFFLEVPEGNRVRRLRIGMSDVAASPEVMLNGVGRVARVRGVLIDNNLVVSNPQDIESEPASAAATTPTMTPVVTGDRSTLVIMGNFSDKTNACSASTLNNGLFSSTASSMNGLYREASRNNVSFNGKVVGPFKIDYSAGGSCDYEGWSRALNAAATAAGHNLSAYKHVAYSIPKASSCAWSGLAYVGGNRSWVNSCSAGVFAHELGHNLKFHHAGTSSAEYGDGTDPMGGASLVQFNAANKVMAGWQPTGTVQDVIGSSTFTLNSTSLTGLVSPQVLRIRKANTSEYYYVSLRTGSGYDLNLASGYRNQVHVHRASGTLPTKSVLLARLGVGNSYADSTNGITITPGTIDSVAGGATVTVAMANAPVATCSAAKPAVALTPVSQTGAPGEARSYALTVTNKDSSACASSTITLAQALPSGFSGSFSPASVTLAPGASASSTWSVTPSAALADAAYTVTASASKASGAASTSATYVVFRKPEVTAGAPTVSITSPSNGSVLQRTKATVAATASSAKGIKNVQFYLGSQLIGTDSSSPYSINWNARRQAAGSYTLKAVATDKAGASAETSISITLK